MKYFLLLALALAIGVSACQKKPADNPPTPEVIQPATPPEGGSTKPAETPPAHQQNPEQAPQR